MLFNNCPARPTNERAQRRHRDRRKGCVAVVRVDALGALEERDDRIRHGRRQDLIQHLDDPEVANDHEQQRPGLCACERDGDEHHAVDPLAGQRRADGAHPEEPSVGGDLEPRQHEGVEELTQQVRNQRGEHESRRLAEHARIRGLVGVVGVRRDGDGSGDEEHDDDVGQEPRPDHRASHPVSPHLCEHVAEQIREREDDDRGRHRQRPDIRHLDRDDVRRHQGGDEERRNGEQERTRSASWCGRPHAAQG